MFVGRGRLQWVMTGYIALIHSDGIEHALIDGIERHYEISESVRPARGGIGLRFEHSAGVHGK
jgi:hypothetical protein